MNPFDDAISHLPEYRMPESSIEDQLRQIHDEAAGARPVRPRRRMRRGLTVVLATGVLVGAGVGAAAALGAFSRAPSERGFAYCYTTVDLDGPRTTFSLASGPNSELPGDSARAAVDICAKNWRAGVFLLTTQDIQLSVDPNGPVVQRSPSLVACVLESGAVGVFPGAAGTCGELGLAVADL